VQALALHVNRLFDSFSIEAYILVRDAPKYKLFCVFGYTIMVIAQAKPLQ
jgi:hypothetical protein